MLSQAVSRTCIRYRVCFNAVVRNITNSKVVCTANINSYNKRTGRGYANDLRHRDLPRVILANKRGFIRAEARLIGVNSGLEKTMLMLDVGKKPKQRKLDEAKRHRIGRMFLEHIFQILCESDRFNDLKGLELDRIDVGPTYKVMNVYWLAKGNESDQVTETLLRDSEDFVRRRLSESLGSHNIPRITFVVERTHLIEQEMNRLFEKADYGMQYRALSHTGAVLGSMADAGLPSGQHNERHSNHADLLKSER